MCHSRAKTNSIHERHLRIIYFDQTSSLGTAGRRQVCLYSQQKCIEMYKASKGVSPPIITGLFKKENEHHYNLRYNSQFTTSATNSLYHGTESISFLGPKIWNILPNKLKHIDSLGVFKLP